MKSVEQWPPAYSWPAAGHEQQRPDVSRKKKEINMAKQSSTGQKSTQKSGAIITNRGSGHASEAIANRGSVTVRRIVESTGNKTSKVITTSSTGPRKTD